MIRKLAACLLLFGCINPPPVVVVDRATALEQQAGGSFADLEKRLARASVAQQPIALTPDQLESLGLSAPTLVDKSDPTDPERVDDMLQRHCVGEGQDGMLADTPDDCQGVTDHQEVLVLIDRVNRARAQLFRWMQQQRPDATLDDLRKKWREAHLRGVVCGAWMQGDDGKWQEKAC